ncbi:A/G-specific adenine glycosylase [Allomuricauda sp. d1]|uniref:A/G-specific adenine glycosylase n=1 Tax=Allomuricauda sp. d1 TaxID=3136725 RepID=UPI0031E12D12
MDFSQKILRWYTENKRELPWRTTQNPYNIWLSEVMLQQTRVAQGLPYYKKFIKAFPTVTDLANASEEKVLKLWQGLGYYSRARNMHATARYVVAENGAEFPKTYEGLLKLKGVGDYTASAIASICYGEPQPVVDGNVYRVLARYFGVDLPTNSTAGIKYFKQLAKEVMSASTVRDYNQGIMEFGAIQCAPKNPNCTVCPLNDGCKALQKGLVGQLPVKLKKNKVKKRFFNYLVLIDSDGNTQLEKRTQKGIWQNLYQFPLLESEGVLGMMDVHLVEEKCKGFGTVSSIESYNQEPIVHKLSHQHLYTKFWVVKLSSVLKNGVSVENVKEYPVPVLMADFINTYKF